MAEYQGSLLPEHGPINQGSPSPPDYQPDAETKKRIKQVQKYFDESRLWRKKYDKNWLKYYRVFRGKQWRDDNVPTYKERPVVNFIFQEIQATVPIMTDSRPEWQYLPEQPGDAEFAQIMSDVATSDWQKYNWLLPLMEEIYDNHMYGIGYGAMLWDKNLNHEAGAPDFRSFDPFYSFPDPNCKTSINKGSRYFIYAEPVLVDVLKAEHPKFKKYIKPDLIDLPSGSREDLTQFRYRSPTDNRAQVEGSPGQELVGANQSIKITCWWYPDDIVEEEQPSLDDSGEPILDPDTNEPKKEFVQKKKWPNGCKSVLINGVMVEDGPNDQESGKIPVSKWNNYMLPREFYGMGDVEQLLSPQMIFNKLVGYALDVLKLTGNPIWIVDNTSLVDTDNLFGQPGLVVEKAPGSDVRRLDGAQLQPYVLQLVDRMKSWFDEIGGQGETSEGNKPDGITAYSAISALQEAAQTRIRQKSRLLDTHLQEMGDLYLDLALQHKTAPEVYRITGNNNVSRYFKMHVEDVPMDDGGIQKKAVVREYGQNAQGQWVEPMEPKEMMLSGKLATQVTTGSSLPFAKNDRATLAFNLFKAGAIDQPELLKSVDYPNWEAVWARVQERQMQQQQQSQQAQQGGQPPSAPPASPTQGAA